jgi:branched-chain amino acid transport system permease protein
VKVIVGALAAFVAAVGGGFIAMYARVAQPQSYATFAGLVWLAVVVTMGVRSISAAALSGLAFALLPGIFQSYVPARWGEVPAVLFGLGAIAVARNPEGAVLQNGRQLRALVARRLARREPPDATGLGAGKERRPTAPDAEANLGSPGAKAEAAP